MNLDPAPSRITPEYLHRQLRRLADNVRPDLVNLDATHEAPSNIEEGDIRLADGTDWNPGGGAGFYGYYGGAWVKLG